jgi:AraC family transcriptional regulator
LAASRRSQYDKRMHAVIEHIDRHLDEELDLATLAGVAHFSAFHFHRVFRVWTGEVLGDYLRRRRLEVAALRLRAQLQVPVLQVALGVGFGSAEAFARAFRTRFGCSPTQWRDSKRGQVTGKAGQAGKDAQRKNGGSRKQENAVNVKLIDRKPVHVAYLRLTGPYGTLISKFWMETVAPWMATNNLFGRDRFGISLDDPTVTKPASCRYDACVQCPDGEVLTGAPQRKVIPGGKYASLAFEGTGAEIGAAWDELLRDWLPNSGLQLDSRPFFEHYPVDGSYDPKTGRFTCNICVPVAPL